MDHRSTTGGARRALAFVRIVMGATALLAPGLITGRLQADPGRNPAAPYFLRLFGIRTVVMGFDLLSGHPRTLRSAPLVHASDALAALAAGRSGQVPWRGAAAAAGLSAVNTALALAALATARGPRRSATAPGAGTTTDTAAETAAGTLAGRTRDSEIRQAASNRPDSRPVGSRR
ncbi:hypothetical protein HS041_33545 [Planomonospora sp. ID67723]|uniref:hypothetical protein n=1 Tax=Planomonospora sp. ID67723 TaxID=2738134 RepID=UPI0018C39A6A|nr:hypothetical protein [Planomonospora sp. ID67723]MBG0832624.1 hypothetical protein [Planomonospora sp. ID67723]